MKQKKTIWISYNGGSNIGVPRAIEPLHWINPGIMFKAICRQSRTEKFFTASKIMEIRDQDWEVTQANKNQQQL